MKMIPTFPCALKRIEFWIGIEKEFYMPLPTHFNHFKPGIILCSPRFLNLSQLSSEIRRSIQRFIKSKRWCYIR